MKEKSITALVVIIILGLAYGAYLEKKDWDQYKKENRCVEIAKEESYTMYNTRNGGSFTQVPERITYQCADGKKITK